MSRELALIELIKLWLTLSDEERGRRLREFNHYANELGEKPNLFIGGTDER